MEEDNFYKQVCQKIENFGTGSITKFVELSNTYKSLSESMAAAKEQYYEFLIGLSDEERSIINQYLTYCTDLQAEYASLAYISGLSDMLDILGQLGLIGCPFATKRSPS